MVDVAPGGGAADDPPGYLLLVEPDGTQRSVAIYDQLFVGRECAGVSPQRRVVISDPEISRSHLEIRLDADRDRAFVIDTSTNGTLLNGARLERAVPIPLKPGDEIRVGDVAMTFVSTCFATVQTEGAGLTATRISQSAVVIVVGDITNYSTISQVTDSAVVAQSLSILWRELGHVLRAHRGTLNHYAGDAICAIWQLRTIPEAETLAVEFALAASKRVDELAPELPLRSPDHSSIRMGWGVVQGMAALAAMTRSVEAVIGDSANVAFRLAGISGRNGRAPVMVTRGVHAATKARFQWGDPEEVELKGRSGREAIYPVVARSKSPVAAAETVKVPTRQE
jgi:class 3 adenylate cyclase